MGLSQKQWDALIPSLGEGAQQPYARKQQKDIQKMSADAKLAELIKGSELKQQAIAQNQAAVEAQAKAQGLKPGKYSQQVSEGGYSVNPENDPFAVQLARGLKSANITGFNIADPTVLPSAKDAEEVKQAAAAVKQGQQYFPTVKKAISDSSALDRFGSMNIGPVRIGSEKGRDLEQRKTALLDYARSLSNTGVLQPGELPMLEKRIGDVTGIGSMMRSPENINKQISEFEEQLRQRADSHSRARGYIPKEGYLGASPQHPTQTPPINPSQDPGFQAWKRSKGL